MGLRPRHYAAAWLKARTKEQKAKAKELLQECPEEWRELVNQHVRNEKAKTKKVQNLQRKVSA